MNVDDDAPGTVAPMDSDESAAAEPAASAEFETADGVELDGEGKLYATADGVRVVVGVKNAPPGKHGFHIHEKGDCSDIPGKSMGGHFAPEGHDHALPSEKDPEARHLGDLGNLEVGEDGNGEMQMVIAKATLKEGSPMNLHGRAFVIHSGEDSGHAKQPSGDSGKPIACAVIN